MAVLSRIFQYHFGQGLMAVHIDPCSEVPWVAPVLVAIALVCGMAVHTESADGHCRPFKEEYTVRRRQSDRVSMRLRGSDVVECEMIEGDVALQVFDGSPLTIAVCLLFMRPAQMLERRTLSADAQGCQSKPVLKDKVELVCRPQAVSYSSGAQTGCSFVRNRHSKPMLISSVNVSNACH